jgi:hypothetical protein
LSYPKKEDNERTPTDAGCPWLTLVILATQEAEIRKISIGSQPQANSLGEPISKKKKKSHTQKKG